MESFKLFVILVLMACCVHQGFTIKCWVCRSDNDPKCADPFDNSTMPIADCDHEQPPEHLKGIKSTMCRKIRQKVHGKWTYFRSCAFMGEPGIGGDERFCLMRTGTHNIFMEYCTCNSKEGCNTSSSIQSSWFIILLTSLIGVRYYMTLA
ncbi:uncharacterized protein crok [Chelonus insularis]|uniref:uncharacterized protein crok n=1 Tax=Chelonus insularis TaxID=460826 RepID=UPI00158C4536|nr:uncharacterized protein LOC118067433 [Chelonus insularis]